MPISETHRAIPLCRHRAEVGWPKGAGIDVETSVNASVPVATRGGLHCDRDATWHGASTAASNWMLANVRAT
jgi:hypothetical protein